MKTAVVVLALASWSFALSAAEVSAQQPQPPVAPPQAATEPSPANKADIPKLPVGFKGEVSGVNAKNFQYSNTLELQIVSQDGGKITGTYSRWMRIQNNPENLCTKADKLPMTGTYDGEKIVLAVKGSINNPAVCNDYSVTLVRGKDHYFERKSPDGRNVWYLDPTK
ncbi:MAG: hypothetical protein ABI724_00350 [Betaproteobacteria bacterium]